MVTGDRSDRIEPSNELQELNIRNHFLVMSQTGLWNHLPGSDGSPSARVTPVQWERRSSE